jgi:hypothetical protein
VSKKNFRHTANERPVNRPFIRYIKFAVKWRFRHQKTPETLILRPQIDIGGNILLLLGDVHAAACGLQSKGCGPSMHLGDFVDNLQRRGANPRRFFAIKTACYFSKFFRTKFKFFRTKFKKVLEIFVFL